MKDVKLSNLSAHPKIWFKNTSPCQFYSFTGFNLLFLFNN